MFVPTGLRLVRAVPPGQVADEPSHILKADALRAGQWMGRRAPSPFGAPVIVEGVDADRHVIDPAVVEPIRPNNTAPLPRPARATRRAVAAIRLGRPRFNEIGTIAGYFPAFYVPGALALAFSRAAGLHALAAFSVVRLFDLLTVAVLGASAIGLARRGRPLIVATLLLPPTLGLAASASQDGILVAAAALAAACASRVGSDRPRWRQPAFLGAAVLVGLVCLAKPPYLPLAALLALPLRRPLRLAVPLAIAAAITGAAAGWTAVAVRRAATPWPLPAAEAGPLWPGARPAVFSHTDMAAQLRVLAHAPWQLVLIPPRSMAADPRVFRELVDVLGWLNLLLPPAFVLAWAVALPLALLGCAAGRESRRPPVVAAEAALLLGATFAAIDLIYLSQYLSYSPVGAPVASGPQGRYFLPLLPLLALAMPRLGAPRLAGAATGVAVAVAACGIVAIPAAARRFYGW